VLIKIDHQPHTLCRHGLHLAEVLHVLFYLIPHAWEYGSEGLDFNDILGGDEVGAAHAQVLSTKNDGHCLLHHGLGVVCDQLFPQRIAIDGLGIARAQLRHDAARKALDTVDGEQGHFAGCWLLLLFLALAL
jgi:hypothetical protein